MIYSNRCNVTIYKASDASAFVIRYPVYVNGEPVKGEREFSISSSPFVYRSSRNKAITRFKRCLRLREVKRDVVDIEVHS